LHTSATELYIWTGVILETKAHRRKLVYDLSTKRMQINNCDNAQNTVCLRDSCRGANTCATAAACPLDRASISTE